MTLFSSAFVQDVFLSLIVEVIIIIIGVIAAHTIIKFLNERRYGKWTVTVIKNGEKKIDNRDISFAKMKQIKDMPEDKPVFLKGICSPYHYIREDLIKDGNNVLFEDRKRRRIIVNLDNDRNEPLQKKTKEESLGKILIQAELMKNEKERPGLISFDEDRDRIIIQLLEDQPEKSVENGL